MHDTLTEPPTSRTLESGGSSSSVKSEGAPTGASASGSNKVAKSALREMSFSEGEKALSPVLEAPPQLKQGDLPPGPGDGELAGMSGAGTAIVESPDDTKVQNGAPPPDEPKKKSEVEEVAELHGQTIDKLVEQLTGLRKNRQSVLVWRKAKAMAADAKSIFALLSQYDSQTITAAWEVARQQAPKAFETLIEAIGKKDAARAYPRESRATLLACEPALIESLARDTVKKNPFACLLAVSLLPPETRAKFEEEHPGLSSSKKLREGDGEKLDEELLTLKDAPLREAEESFRERMTAAKEGDAKKAEAAEGAKEGAKEGASSLVAKVKELAGKKRNQEALVLLAAEADEATFLAAVRTLDDGTLSAIIRRMTFDQRWNQSGDQVKRVFGARVAEKNLADAKILLDVANHETRIVQKKSGREKTRKRSELTSAEAYEAYHMLKALPAAHRELFQKNHAELVAAMEMHLNASMRAADDTNMLGEADRETAAQLAVKIRGDALWLEAPADQLELTLRMALKLNLRAEIRAKLESMRGAGIEALYADSARRSAVEAAIGKVEVEGLPEQMPEAERWAATLKMEHVVSKENGNTGEQALIAGKQWWAFWAWGGKGTAVRAMAQANKATRRENREERKKWKEAKARGEEVGEEPAKKTPTLAGQVWNTMASKKGFEVENLALDQLGGNVNAYAYGGDLEFRDFGDRKGKNGGEDRNRADIRFLHNEGVFEFKCPHLELVRLRYPMGDMVVETGPAVMKDVRLSVTWPTPQAPEQRHSVTASASAVEVADIMVTMPGALVGIKSLVSGALDLSAAEQQNSLGDNPGAAEAIALLKAHNPARSLIGFGLGTAGMLGKRREREASQNLEALMTAFTGKPQGALGGMALTCDGMNATGISYNADVFLQQAAVGKVEMLIDNRPTVTGARRIGQLNGMIEAASVQLEPRDGATAPDEATRKRVTADIERWSAERSAIEGKLPEWASLEKLYQEVYEHQKRHGPRSYESEAAVKALRDRAASMGVSGAESMSPSQIAASLQARLTADSGLMLSVESVSASGADAMGTRLDEASVKGIHLSVKGDAVGDEVDPRLMKRLGSKDGEASPEGKPVVSGVALDVASVSMGGFEMAGAAPTVEALQKTRHRMGELAASVAALSAKEGLDKEQKRQLEEEKHEFEAIEAQWTKVVVDGMTYGQVAEEMMAMAAKPGLDAVRKSADQLQRWTRLEDAIKGEPLSIESVVVAGIAMKAHSVDVKDGRSSTLASMGIGSAEVSGVKQGSIEAASVKVADIKAEGAFYSETDAATKESSMGGSGAFRVGSAEVEGLAMGDLSMGKASLSDFEANAAFDQKTKMVKGSDGKEKEEVLERTASSSLDLAKVTASDVDLGGTRIKEAGLEQLHLSLTGDAKGTQVAFGLGRAQVTGVGMEKGIETAERQLAALDAQVLQLKGQGKDPKEIELSKRRLEEGLASYRQAYADQDLVMGELEAIDEQIDAAQGRLRAAQRELEIYDHRVDARAEKRKNEADKARVGVVQKEIEGLAAQRAEVQKKLVEPQKIISDFESSLGIEGTASIDNIELKVSGLPTLKELAKEDPDLGSKVKIELGIGPLKIPTIDYRSPGMNVGLASAEMGHVTAEAYVTIEKQQSGDGKSTLGIGAVEVRDFSIPSIVGTGLRLTMPVEGELVEIELPSASIKGMALSGVHLPGLDAESMKTAKGRFDIKSIEASMSAKMGDSLQANGTLSVTDIYADALSSGMVNFGLNGLTLDKLGFESKTKEKNKKGDSIVSSIAKMGGKASRLGKLDVSGGYDRVTNLLSTTVALGDLTLSGIDYRGAGTSLGVGFAQLKGASVTVGAKFRDKAEEGKGALEYLDITEVKADSLRGTGIGYTGTGTKRERFQDGTLKETPFSSAIFLKKGTLHGFAVRGIRVVGEGVTNISASLGSGTVEGLAVGMKENGKNVLQANVSANVSGVSVRLVDDDMTASFASFKGDAALTSGDGESAMNIDVKGVDVRGDEKQRATVSMNDMGKESASTSANLPVVHAREIGFEQGLKGSGYNKPFMLGTATLNDVKFRDDKDKLSVDIGKGQGLMLGGIEVTGQYSGSTEEEKKQGATNDQFFVPTQLVTWKNLEKSSLDGFLRLNYPDKSQFLRLNFANNGVSLDLQENIDRMWTEWQRGFESNGESTFAYLWKAYQTVLRTPNNLLWHAVFRGLEKGFNLLAANLLGSWPDIEKMILESLNTNPKTSIVKGHTPAEGDKTFTSFTQSINQVIQDYVEPAIETACDWGLVYDVIHGDYGRAAKTTGAWLLEQGGNLVDWGGSLFGYDNVTNVDDEARKYREAMRAQRKAEMEAMVKSGLDKVLGWGLDLDLHTQGGDYQANKVPNPNPKGLASREMLRTQLALDMSGGGTLKDMSLGTQIGLSRFRYSDAGNTASIDKLTMGAAASGGAKHAFEDDGVRMKDAKLAAGGGVYVTFEGLKYEQDKNFKAQKPAGTMTAEERFKLNGTPQEKQAGLDGPLSTSSGVLYDSGDYANRVKTKQGVIGPRYSSELTLKETAIKTAAQYTLDPLTGLPISKAYETQKITARNAEIYGKYETQYDTQKRSGGAK